MIKPQEILIKWPKDRSKITLVESWEVDYWTHKFNCTKEELIKIMEEIGNSALSVELFFMNN
jgi:hypothetical protein